MKYISRKSLVVGVIILAIVALLCVNAQAQVYVVCDEYTTTMVLPEYFKVTLDGAQSNAVPEVLSNGSKRLHFVVGTVSVATHNMTVAACLTDPWLGTEVCSAIVPFSFTRPAVPVVSKPTSIGLVR